LKGNQGSMVTYASMCFSIELIYVLQYLIDMMCDD